MTIKILFLSIASLLFQIKLTAQGTGTFKDPRDGKIYKTITAGKQVWMAENLAYKASSGCWSYPDDDEDFEEDDLLSNIKIFGYLYNWETAKKVCPAGWHLPTRAEWEILFQTLGGEKGAGFKMKSATGWSKNGNGNNESGFNALGGGNVYANLTYKTFKYNDIFKFGSWWSASEENDLIWSYKLIYNSNDIYRTYEAKENGISVRCIKD